jgi:hypothetical protein
MAGIRVKALDAVQVRAVNRKYHTMQCALAILAAAGILTTMSYFSDDHITGILAGMFMTIMGTVGVLSVELSRREALRLVTGSEW